MWWLVCCWCSVAGPASAWVQSWTSMSVGRTTTATQTRSPQHIGTNHSSRSTNCASQSQQLAAPSLADSLVPSHVTSPGPSDSDAARRNHPQWDHYLFYMMCCLLHTTHHRTGLSCVLEYESRLTAWYISTTARESVPFILFDRISNFIEKWHITLGTFSVYLPAVLIYFVHIKFYKK